MTLPACVRMALAIMATVVLAGCIIKGTVSTAYYSAPPQPPTFTVLSSDSLSLTERNISALIETKMSERGFLKAASIEAANIGVLYKHSISPTGSIVGDSDIAGTVFPRNFQIIMIDLQKSKLPEKLEILWQGELYSTGTGRNMSTLAPTFIDELFSNYGKTVTNSYFIR